MSQEALKSLRANVPDDVWTARARPLSYGREDFRLTLIRTKRRMPRVQIDSLVTHFNWGRVDDQKTAELNFNTPLETGSSAIFAPEDEVLCEVAPNGAQAGGWAPLWRLTVQTPSHDVGGALISLALSGSLSPLIESKLAWKYRADRRHPGGWTAAQITRHVADRLGVTIEGQLPTATHRISRLLEHKAAGIDVLARAWKADRTVTGRRFDIDISTGRLAVREIREPRYMLLIADEILEATVERTKASLATIVVATATVKKRGAKKARKIRVRVVDRDRRKTYGDIVRTLDAPAGIDTEANLRRWAQARLEESFRPRQALPLTLPGLPFVDRGDATRVQLPQADLDAIAFVTEARHDVSAGAYTMQLQLDFDDYYADARADRVAAAKKAKATRRGRRVMQSGDGLDVTNVPKPLLAELRS